MKIRTIIKKIILGLGNEKLAYCLLALYAALLLVGINFYYANSIPKICITLPKLTIVAIFAARILLNWRQVFRQNKIPLIIVAIILSINTFMMKNSSLIQLFILSIGSFTLNFRQIIKYIACTELLVGMLIIASTLVGIVPDRLIDRSTSMIATRHSLGFRYSTEPAIWFMQITICFLFLKTKNTKWWGYALLMGVNIILLVLTQSRLPFILSVAAICIFFLYNQNWNKIKRRLTTKIKTIIFLLPIVLSLCTITATIVYTPSSSFMARINKISSNRLQLGQRALKNKGVSIFGQKISWSTPSNPNNKQPMDIVDSFYIQLLISYGVVIFILFIIMSELFVVKYIKNPPYLIIMTLLLIQGISDSWMFSLQWNAFSLLLFTAILRKEEKHKESIPFSLDKLHEIQLSMLKKFAKFCDKNNLTYYLCGGTLLGAVRHKGFIPWDDDVDILMPRPDYERLISLTSNDAQITKNLIIQNPHSRGSTLPFIKVYNLDYHVVEHGIQKKISNHIWLDVFPMDGLSNNMTQNQILYKKVIHRRKLLYFKQLYAIYTIRHSKSILKAIIKPFMITIAKLTPYRTHAKKIDRLSQTYPYETSKYVGGVMWGYGPHERMLKKDVEKKVLIEFEGEKFYTFSCYEEYLTNLYGDYMQLPPEDERQTHLVSIIKAKNNKERE